MVRPVQSVNSYLSEKIVSVLKIIVPILNSDYFWLKIKRATNGYLRPAIYRNIYAMARSAPAGDIVDIGPAQGGSSIALTLGRKNSGRDGKVYSIDLFKGSAALLHMNDIDINVRTLKENIRKFGAPERSTVLIGVCEAVHEKIAPGVLGMIFIDADGALDRDFQIFYDRLAPGAPMVIDDYENSINNHARNRYLKWNSDKEVQAYLKTKGVDDLMFLCPLGKHYTVFRFVNYMVENGFIENMTVKNNTVFGRKPDGAPAFNTPEVAADMLKIRQSIMDDYQAERENYNPEN